MNVDYIPKFLIGNSSPDVQTLTDFQCISHVDGESFPLIKFHDLDRILPIISGEYYWLFTLKRTLYGMGFLPRSITVALSDMFTLSSDIGHSFSNTEHYKFLRREDIEKANISYLTAPHTGYNWLIGQPMFFGESNTIIENYRDCHHLGDLLRFSADAIDSSLSPDYILAFLKSDFIFPYPSVGTFETKPFFRILDILENIAFRFLARGWERRDGYQQKNVRFLLERLHSFLLTVHLESAGLLNNQHIYGYKTILSEVDIYKAH